YRTALEARRAATKRRAKEAKVPPRTEPAITDLRAVLDQELAALPEPYREAVVLCDLEGKTRKEAARECGLAEGTVASRLAGGRRMLARRLTRQGLALPAGALAASLQGAASACVPLPLISTTVRAAALVAAGQAVAAHVAA